MVRQALARREQPGVVDRVSRCHPSPLVHDEQLADKVLDRFREATRSSSLSFIAAIDLQIVVLHYPVGRRARFARQPTCVNREKPEMYIMYECIIITDLVFNTGAENTTTVANNGTINENTIAVRNTDAGDTAVIMVVDKSFFIYSLSPRSACEGTSTHRRNCRIRLPLPNSTNVMR